LLEHPKNRRIHYEDNDVEWLSFKEIKQIVAYHDNISANNMKRQYQLPFLPPLNSSMVEEARLLWED
jgi:hypothetical protein